MADSVALSTIGVKFGWAAETVAGTKPTAFKEIANCKEIGGIDLSTDSIDVTPLSKSVKQYIQGLQDTGGTWDVTFFGNDDFVDAWNEVLTAYGTAKKSGLSIWFVVWIPDMSDSFYVVAQPGKIPMPQIGVGNALEFGTSNTINEYKGLDTAIEPTAA